MYKYKISNLIVTIDKKKIDLMYQCMNEKYLI